MPAASDPPVSYLPTKAYSFVALPTAELYHPSNSPECGLLDYIHMWEPNSFSHSPENGISVTEFVATSAIMIAKIPINLH